MKLYNPDSTHWYTRNGEPMHTVTMRKGGERPTDLRNARKYDLLPSVTNVLGIIAKPELINWKMEQAVLSALTLPRNAGETEDQFAKRVVEDSLSKVREAAEFGTAIHAGAQRIAENPLEVPEQDPFFPWLNLYRDWFHQNCDRVMWTERVLVSDAHGFAGTADLLMVHRKHGLCLVDIKTQGIRPASLPRIYFSWLYQLAAYAQVIGGSLTCINLIVNSSAPEIAGEQVWTAEHLAAGWEVFQAAHLIWRHEKNYNPIRRPEPIAEAPALNTPAVAAA